MAQPDFVFRGHRAAVNSVHFFAEDRLLVSGDQGGAVAVWSMPLRRQLAGAAAAHAGAVLAVSSAGAGTVISQGRDNALRVWALQAGEFAGELRLAAEVPVDSMSFCKFARAPGTAWLAALEEAGTGAAYVYSTATGERLGFCIARKTRTRMGGREDPPMCLALAQAAAGSDHALDLYVGYESTALARFALRLGPGTCTASAVWEVQTPHTEPLMSIGVCAGRVYTCAADSRVCSFAADAPAPPRAVGTLPNPGAAEVCCSAGPPRPLVVVAGWDYAAHVLAADDLAPVRRVRFHREPLTSVDVSAHSREPLPGDPGPLAQQRWAARPRWLAAASRDGRISLWALPDHGTTSPPGHMPAASG
ncbi:Astra associated protein 1 Asa1 [Coemansia javaensis]|uniref:ASTRA-associated protein 1 n=1 Tax=Coemansia javaensis TaxID=2761396 RepID=A0A9W8H1Y1_9FUNG|nr:Astra associated protein 1 Asa1 [Coemansia javaensis]